MVDSVSRPSPGGGVGLSRIVGTDLVLPLRVVLSPRVYTFENEVMVQGGLQNDEKQSQILPQF